MQTSTSSPCSARVFRTLAMVGTLATIGCASVRPTVEPLAIPPPRPTAANAGPSRAAIGVVLTGGGAFGAWEVGALLAFYDDWRGRHGEDPPVKVVAGTSTGALIAPFVLLAEQGGRTTLEELGRWYSSISQSDIARPRLSAVLPLPLFAKISSSIYNVGLSDSPANARRLHALLVRALPDKSLEELRSAWPERRLAVTALDFENGQPHIFTNAIDEPNLLRKGILSSAMAPFAFPPVPLPSGEGAASAAGRSPHLDGGVFASAPFSALLEVASDAPAIHLTHIVVIASFPPFPGNETGMIQQPGFPRKPDFGEIGDRFTTLFSEASADKDIALVRAALALRELGAPARQVRDMTGLHIPGQSPVLIELRPRSRLGWHALRFRQHEMREFLRRGYDEANAQLSKANAEPH